MEDPAVDAMAKTKVRQALTATVHAPGASGFAKLLLRTPSAGKSPSRRDTARPGKTFDVVNKVKVGTLKTGAIGNGTAKFSTAVKGRASVLGFDPRGAQIAVRDADTDDDDLELNTRCGASPVEHLGGVGWRQPLDAIRVLGVPGRWRRPTELQRQRNALISTLGSFSRSASTRRCPFAPNSAAPEFPVRSVARTEATGVHRLPHREERLRSWLASVSNGSHSAKETGAAEIDELRQLREEDRKRSDERRSAGTMVGVVVSAPSRGFFQPANFNSSAEHLRLLGSRGSRHVAALAYIEEVPLMKARWRFARALAVPVLVARSFPAAAASPPGTPIGHVVVIFQENVSFDHYFGTYPSAANNDPSEPPFIAAPDTPSVNGLTGALLTNNPNGVNPFRLTRAQAATCDQDHNYTDEQTAFHFGLMDNFLALVPFQFCSNLDVNVPNEIMGYFDGNTVTALWNYAQRFAMNDNSFGTTFGPSTPGAINLIAGNTFGANSGLNTTPHNKPATPSDLAGGSVIADPQPSDDVCTTRDSIFYTSNSTTVGDLLSAAGNTWGWFMGGFDLTVTNANGTTGCARSTLSAVTGVTKLDYIPHHQPFQYFARTRNPAHVRPSRVSAIGFDDRANHQYDLHDFFDAARAGNMPQVAFLKAPGYQDGHAQYSDPLDEQKFLVDTINFLMRRPEWRSTAVFILYDDSDGWYDHQMGPIVHHSQTSADTLSGTGMCGGTAPADAQQGRCGYGPRMPFVVVSPFAKRNFVDHTTTDQSSITRFIEDNFGLGRIDDGSSDAYAGSVLNMFDFSQRGEEDDDVVLLDDQSGEPVQ